MMEARRTTRTREDPAVRGRPGARCRPLRPREYVAPVRCSPAADSDRPLRLRCRNPRPHSPRRPGPTRPGPTRPDVRPGALASAGLAGVRWGADQRPVPRAPWRNQRRAPRASARPGPRRRPGGPGFARVTIPGSPAGPILPRPDPRTGLACSRIACPCCAHAASPPSRAGARCRVCCACAHTRAAPGMRRQRCGTQRHAVG